MKLGSQRIEHFAHQKDSQCTESYERESDYHINGKLQLFQWLEMQNLSPVLEPYYQSIRQRPDIGFTYQFKLCTRISMLCHSPRIDGKTNKALP